MSGPVIQGWCPGALRPMLSGDGLVVRIRAHLGRLTSAQAQEIARLARAHGNGLIDLSARANLQLRGVRNAGHAPLVEGLAALGLIDADIAREARRNILITPFWQEGEAAPRLARALEAALGTPDAPALPGKFGFAIDTGATPVLRARAADIRIERAVDGQCLVLADGAMHGACVAEKDAIACAIELAGWFLESGGAPGGRGRMRKHLAAGATLPPRFCAAPRVHQTTPEPLPGLYPQGALVGLGFGQMQAETLEALAGIGALRLTPWRALLIEGMAALPDIGGLITRADDPMLRVIACTGAPGCPQGLGETRALARALAPFVPQTRLLHVSGCAKGCAHAGTAPLTLVATHHGYDLIRDGDAAARPTLTGLPPDVSVLSKVL